MEAIIILFVMALSLLFMAVVKSLHKRIENLELLVIHHHEKLEPVQFAPLSGEK